MISLPEILKSHGYFTAQAGKFHMGEYAIRGFDQVHDKKNINGPGGENYWEQLVGNVPEDQPFFFGWPPMTLTGTGEQMILLESIVPAPSRFRNIWLMVPKPVRIWHIIMMKLPDLIITWVGSSIN